MATINQLPDTAISIIICHLTPQDQQSLRQVSRRFRDSVKREIAILRKTRPSLRLFDYVDRWISSVNTASEQARLAVAGYPALWMHVGMPTTWFPVAIVVYDLAAGNAPLRHPDTNALLPNFDDMPEDDRHMWRKTEIARLGPLGEYSVCLMRRHHAIETLPLLLRSFDVSWHCFGYTTPGDIVYEPCLPPEFLPSSESGFDMKKCYMNRDTAARCEVWSERRRESYKHQFQTLVSHGFGICTPLKVFKSSNMPNAILYVPPYSNTT